VRGGARLDLGRPTLSPKDNKQLFMEYLGVGEDAGDDGDGNETKRGTEYVNNPKWVPGGK